VVPSRAWISARAAAATCPPGLSGPNIRAATQAPSIGSTSWSARSSGSRRPACSPSARSLARTACLWASAPARIVNVTSSAQAFGDLHLDDRQFQPRYRGQAAYNQSKLANALFTCELARRLEGTGVTVNCAAPGVTRTNFGRDDSGPVMRLLAPLARPFMRSPEQGADTPVWLASAPEVEGETGGYYARRRARRSSRRSYDPELARRLWRVSEELTGLRQPA
jgi:retinol dehydrogenase 14